MTSSNHREHFADTWPAVANAAFRIAFGIIWAVNAAFTWTPQFAAHYVGYLHNAAQGQPHWSAFWFDMWIAVVTPHAALFVWLTRLAETALAIALLFGVARRTAYVAGGLFSLLIWSTAEGFGGPYVVGATNMGVGISYVLIFAVLIAINNRSTTGSPYSLDYHIEKLWPRWRLIAEWNGDLRPRAAHVVSWRTQGIVAVGIAILVFFLAAGLHSSLHVKPPTPAAAAAAVEPLSLAATTPIAKARDARLPPVQSGPVAQVHITVKDKTIKIASGVQYKAWTFGGTVPGPVIHVRQGQQVDVVLTNHGMMAHSIDFHAAVTPPNLHYVDIQPGESIKFSFVAKVAGAFLYHCETSPTLLHIGNGMYGALIVDPVTPLPPAAESYVLVQSEWFTRQVAGKLMAGDYAKMQEDRPDEVVFNGAAFQYRQHPLPALPGKRVRIYFVNAGPDAWSSFHVIGAILNTVYPDGDAAHALTGVSTYEVGPGAGAVFDLILDQPGKYPFVDHDMAHAMIGAVGVLAVHTPGVVDTQEPPIVKAPAPQAAPAPAAAQAKKTVAAGPYTFDPQRGAALYASHCSMCHQPSGTGLPGAFPPLKGDPVVLNPNPKQHIGTVLHGKHGVVINGKSYAAAMPPFESTLSDAKIADIINHERSSWGNKAKLITPEQVKATR